MQEKGHREKDAWSEWSVEKGPSGKGSWEGCVVQGKHGERDA